MPYSAVVARLRQSRFWRPLRGVYGNAALAICAAVSWVVRRAGTVVPENLYLKHRYDHNTLLVRPDEIRYEIKVGVSRPHDSKWARGGRLSLFRDWVRLGGGWKSVKKHPSRNLHDSFVADGDWDLRRDPFQMRPIVMEILSRGSVERTEQYRKMRRWVDAGDYRWTKGVRSVPELERYFAELVHTVESIRAHGYQSQEELGNPGGDEVRVCIDRDGNLCVYGGGTHRLTAAQALGLDAIPVILKRVHAAWARRWLERSGGPLRHAIERGLKQYEVRLDDERNDRAEASGRSADQTMQPKPDPPVPEIGVID